MLRIELDSVRKYRSANEYRPVNRASCEGMESVGDGENIKALAKMLIEAGHAPDTPVQVWRNGTLCFDAIKLEVWANGAVGRGKQPEHLRKAEKINSSAE